MSTQWLQRMDKVATENSKAFHSPGWNVTSVFAELTYQAIMD